MSAFGQSWQTYVAAALTIMTSATAAAGGDAVKATPAELAVSITSRPSERLRVLSTGSLFDRIEAEPAGLLLRGRAQLPPQPDGRVIVSSAVLWKAEAAGTGADGGRSQRLDGEAGAQTLSIDQPASLAIDGKGAIGRQAIALCNAQNALARPASELLSLNVDVVWRVTTGRFHFSYLAYDHVAPTTAVRADPNFYSELISTDAVRSVALAVDCVRDAAPVATPAGIPPAPSTVAAATTASRTGIRVIGAPQSTSATPTPLAPRAAPPTVADSACRGGIERAVSSSPETMLCLCPANTRRVEDVGGAVTCARRVAQP